MDELMDMVLKRFEDIVMRLSGEMIDRVYWSILGELQHNGYDMAYRYVTTAKLNDR